MWVLYINVWLQPKYIEKHLHSTSFVLGTVLNSWPILPADIRVTNENVNMACLHNLHFMPYNLKVGLREGLQFTLYKYWDQMT